MTADEIFAQSFGLLSDVLKEVRDLLARAERDDKGRIRLDAKDSGLLEEVELLLGDRRRRQTQRQTDQGRGAAHEAGFRLCV